MDEPGNYCIEDVEENEEETIRSSTVRVHFKILYKILSDLDAEYWMKHTGFDG